MDIRVDTALVRHPRLWRLARAWGESRHHALGRLVAVWCGFAELDRTGATPMTGVDLARAAEWSEDQRHLVAALVAAGFLDPIDGGFVPTEWAERQPHLVARDHIYFFRCRDCGAVKIGFSNDPARRRRRLGGRLDVLGAVHGDRRLESELHERFSRQRIEHGTRPGRTEWFRDSDDLRAAIDELCGVKS